MPKRRVKLTKAEKKKINSISEKAKADRKQPYSAQDTIAYKRMFPDGICCVHDGYYTKTSMFGDINYQLAQNEDKSAIFEGWCDFLNYFDSSVRVQFSFVNMATNAENFEQSIMIPEQADARLVHWGTRSYLDELMEAGVKIYLYQKGFLHSKLMVCDDCLATVGSTNIDFRSFEQNFEVNAFLYDRASALQLTEIFLADQKDAKLLHRKAWRLRPWSQKVKESVIRLFAPLL